MSDKHKYVMCINSKGYPLDLTVHKVYKIMPDLGGEEVGMIRIVDDSGEDYLYAIGRFVPVELSAEAEQSFELEVA
jgi:hypothetical protein